MNRRVIQLCIATSAMTALAFAIPSAAGAAPNSGSADGSSGAGAPQLQPAPPRTGVTPNGVVSISVNNQLTGPVENGIKTGPFMYQRGSGGHATVSFSWTAKDATGNHDKSDCQMEVQVTGPQTYPVVKSANCIGHFATSFNGSENGVQANLPGQYTITAIDRVSGTTGTGSFTIS